MDPDRAFVDRAQQGDLEAFGELVRRHQHRMVNYLRALVFQPADAEDVAQEAFLRAHRGIRQFTGASSFKTWLYQIATNVARTELAKRRRDPIDAPAEVNDPDHPSQRAIDRLEAPGNFEAAFAARDALGRALAALPVDLREAVVLRDVEGFEYRDISVALGVPMGTVESRIFRGRERLRAAVTAQLRGEAAS